jgi:outer membrane protein TolC
VGLLPLALLAGCARFEPKPVVPGQTAAALEERSLTNAALRGFIETNLTHPLGYWPPPQWDLETLTLAAFYYQPNLEVARAQLAVAQAGEVTAGQRPNPTLNVTPGRNFTTTTPSPWLPLGSLDIPIETAGKRGHRRAQASHLAESARLNLAAAGWQARGDLRSALLELTAASRRERLLRAQLGLQAELVLRQEQQVQAGALSSSEVLPARVARQKAELDLAEARRQATEARAHVAEAVGVPAHALDGVQLVHAWAAPGAGDALTTASARRAALTSRPDILGALADYEASQSALQLEIAKQYPDVHLQPGYEFDQGDSKWSLGLTVELPVLNHNQGAIAEAKARRQEAAAKFNALQAKVLAEIDKAEAAYQFATNSLAATEGLAAAQSKRLEDIRAQFNAGAAERVDVLSAQIEAAAADLLRLESQLKLQQSLAALEDAVQRPLPQATHSL